MDQDLLREADARDQADELRRFRKEFSIPLRKSVCGTTPITERPLDPDDECTYLCGNSLGLMPKRSRERVIEELDVWSQQGVEGHWNHPHARPWVTIDETVKDGLASLVGARPLEVTAMNTLTSNLHSMMVTFYRPTEKRFKILIEEKAFPSDHYAVASHIQSRGIDSSVGLLTVGPRKGEHVLRTEDIIETIRDNKDIALVLLSGVQYYTGQFFDIETITKAGHTNGCIVGWDLAHAIGNVKLQLHDWDVDFACWCSYKYLNSGPGGIAGLFVHEKYANDTDRSRLAGWWGNDKANRFEMKPEFKPSVGAAGYQVSNPSVIAMASLLGSLQVFEEAGFDRFLEKSTHLTNYMEKLLLFCLDNHHKNNRFQILTPGKRGCQLSLEFPDRMMDIFNYLYAHGVICDERKPTVIRIAPNPLYNTFSDVRKAVLCLKDALDEIFPDYQKHHQ